MSLDERREGIEAGRLDLFVDSAFALTLTLLLIGGDVVPDSASRLLLPLSASNCWWGLPGYVYFLMLLAWLLMRRYRRKHGVT